MPPLSGMQLVSALAHQEDIDAELGKEVRARKVLGPFPSTLRETSGPRGWEWYLKMNNKCRVILHLFAPEGHSVNDFIIREEFTLHYSTMDDAVALLGRLDRGALMAKLDLQAAFRMVPVLASEWELLGMYWHDKYYVDTCLPFGVCSAPSIFDNFASALHWILQHNYGATLLHYLDYFLLLGQPMLDTSTSTAGRALEDHLQLLITRAVAPSTPSTYRAGTRRYISFCQAYGLKSLPRSKHTIVLFGTSAGHSRLTPSRPKRLQLTNTMLDRMLGLLNTDSLLMLKAALTLGFFGLLRVRKTLPGPKAVSASSLNGPKQTRLGKAPLFKWAALVEQHVPSWPCKHTSATAGHASVLHRFTSSPHDHPQPERIYPARPAAQIRIQFIPVQYPQLVDWCSNCSSTGRTPSIYHSKIRTMAQLCLHNICPTSLDTSQSHGKNSLSP
ncbi:hypothetical protein EMCRGX_G003199 [Ephydatia muelleri]